MDSQLLRALVAAIEASEFSRYQIAKETGVAASQLSRLVRSESGMSVSNVEKVAEFLGYEVVLWHKQKSGRSRP